MSADLEREAREAAEAAADSLGAMGAWETADGRRDRPGVRFNFTEAFRGGYLAAATLREKEIEGQRHFFNLATEEIATLRARVAELEMVVANYLPVCIGDCGCEGSLAGCAILGDDPEASAIAESVAAKMVPPPETKP